MPEILDCRGLSCPEPVLQARQLLANTSSDSVTVIVSSAAARDNVTRAAAGLGWKASLEPVADCFKLILTK